MLEYVEACKVQYVKCVLLGAKDHAKDEGLSERGIKALFNLSKERGRDAFIPINDIYLRSGIEPNQSGSAGLWLWLVDKTNAGIVERLESQRAYRIRKEFYRAVERVLSEYAQQI